MNRPKAVDFQIPVPKRGFTITTLVTAEHQPAWATESGVIVGYQGLVTTRAIRQRLARAGTKAGVFWDYALLRARPRPAQRTNSGDRSLCGLTMFDTKTAHAETRHQMGQHWFQAAVQLLKVRNESFDRLTGVDFNDPQQYVPAFPECAAQIFENLPDLDVVIGLMMSPITDALAWVAMMPMSKVAVLTEQAYMDHGKGSVMIRLQGEDGRSSDIALPGKRKHEAAVCHS